MSQLTPTQKIIKGMQIVEDARLAQDDPGTPYHYRALHDEIVCGDLEWITDDATLAELEELGWHRNDDYNGFVFSV